MDEFEACLEPYRRSLTEQEVEGLMRKSETDLTVSDIVSLCRNEYFVQTQRPKSCFRKWPYKAIHLYLVEKKMIPRHGSEMGYR